MNVFIEMDLIHRNTGITCVFLILKWIWKNLLCLKTSYEYHFPFRISHSNNDHDHGRLSFFLLHYFKSLLTEREKNNILFFELIKVN